MGISGFEPTFLVGLEAVREEHGAGLAALGGRRLTGFALVRFVEDGDWFADCPVVLDFDGVQAEICHWKFDELSISWNSIDTTAAISGWEYVEQTPAWSDADERLESFVGQELREVALLEWRPSSRHDLADGTLAGISCGTGWAEALICRGVGPAGVEMSASRPSSRSRAFVSRGRRSGEG